MRTITPFIKILFPFVFLFLTIPAFSLTNFFLWLENNQVSIRLQGGFNIGGITPIPIPAEIRSINAYDPGLAMTLDAFVHKGFTNNFGLLTGIRFENKGMDTIATTKNYKMSMNSEDSGIIKGYWTGKVETNVKSSWISLPLLATYNPIESLEVQLGMFLSWLIKGSFTGYVYDGYLRENTPTGNKIVFSDNAKADYDFSNEMRIFQWGMQTGIMYNIWRSLGIRFEVSWGFCSIFSESFETITFGMYPIFSSIGISYIF